MLFAHGNYLDPAIRLPASTTIIYCPRTHAAFGHPPHPFRDFLARGVRVALGTDSLASNPDLDLLAEARFVHRQYPDFSGATLLRAGFQAMMQSALRKDVDVVLAESLDRFSRDQEDTAGLFKRLTFAAH